MEGYVGDGTECHMEEEEDDCGTGEWFNAVASEKICEDCITKCDECTSGSGC